MIIGQVNYLEDSYRSSLSITSHTKFMLWEMRCVQVAVSNGEIQKIMNFPTQWMTMLGVKLLAVKSCLLDMKDNRMNSNRTARVEKEPLLCRENGLQAHLRNWLHAIVGQVLGWRCTSPSCLGHERSIAAKASITHWKGWVGGQSIVSLENLLSRTYMFEITSWWLISFGWKGGTCLNLWPFWTQVHGPLLVILFPPTP